jgi:hypothetical protein
MNRYIATLLLLSATVASAAEPASSDWVKDPASQTVFFAVLEGIYMDGVENEHVDLILPPNKEMSEHFVDRCPLCHSVVEALRFYRTRSHFQFQKPKTWGDSSNGFKPSYSDTLGKGLAPEVVAGLRAPEKEARIKAIKELISVWINRRLVLTCKDETEYRAAANSMRELSKKGSELLNRYRGDAKNDPKSVYFERKTCPACEGVAAGGEPLFSHKLARALAVAPKQEYYVVMPEVFFSVLEELYRAGVANADLDAFIGNNPEELRTVFESHFVYGCQLCHASWEAMRMYRQRPVFANRKDTASNFGPGLPAGLSAQLRSPDKAQRMAGIELLIRTAVENKIAALKLSPTEKQAWTIFIEDARKRGLELLKGYQSVAHEGRMDKSYADRKGCPACDGSSAACKLPKPDPMLKPRADPNF